MGAGIFRVLERTPTSKRFPHFAVYECLKAIFRHALSQNALTRCLPTLTEAPDTLAFLKTLFGHSGARPRDTPRDTPGTLRAVAGPGVCNATIFTTHFFAHPWNDPCLIEVMETGDITTNLGPPETCSMI